MIVNTRGARVGSRRVGRRLLVCVSAVALLAACNGDDDTASSTVPAPTAIADVASTLSATTAPPPSSANGAPPTTAAAPTTAPATTSAPSTTQPTSASSTAAFNEEALVLSLVDNTYRVWRECLRAIATCDTATFGAYFTGPLLQNRVETVAEWRALNYEVVNVDSYTYEVLDMDLASTIPYVLVCETDGGAVVERMPGEPERVIDQRYVERVRELHLVRTADGWRAEGFATREEAEGREGALCGE